MDLEAKIRAHRRAGFGVPSTKTLSGAEWQALRAWIKLNPEAKFRRYEVFGSKVFYAYSQSVAGGMFFTTLGRINQYNQRKKSVNKPLKHYKRTLGNNRDSRFKAWSRKNASSAKSRGLEHTLSKDEMLELFEKHCFFCGEIPVENKTWGIDRLQNKVGYTYDNCVPCCVTCNYAKGTCDLHDFLDRVHTISKKFQ